MDMPEHLQSELTDLIDDDFDNSLIHEKSVKTRSPRSKIDYSTEQKKKITLTDMKCSTNTSQLRKEFDWIWNEMDQKLHHLKIVI